MHRTSCDSHHQVNGVPTHNGVLFGLKGNWNDDSYGEMDGTGDHCAKQSKSDADRHCTFSLTCGLWEGSNGSKTGSYWGCGRKEKGRSERELDGVHMIKAHGLMVEPLYLYSCECKNISWQGYLHRRRPAGWDCKEQQRPQVSRCRGKWVRGGGLHRKNR